MREAIRALLTSRVSAFATLANLLNHTLFISSRDFYHGLAYAIVSVWLNLGSVPVDGNNARLLPGPHKPWRPESRGRRLRRWRSENHNRGTRAGEEIRPLVLSRVCADCTTEYLEKVSIRRALVDCHRFRELGVHKVVPAQMCSP